MMRYFILISLLTICFNSFSQHRIGLSASPNISDNYDSKLTNIESKFSFDFALIYSLSISKYFSISSGVGLTRKSYEFDVSDYRPLDPADDLLPQPNNPIYMSSYIEIPLLINALVSPKSKYRIYSEAGVLNNFLISTTVKNEIPSNILDNDYSGYLIGIKVGFGVERTINDKYTFRIGPNLKYQLSETYIDSSLYKFNSYGIELSFFIHY